MIDKSEYYTNREFKSEDKLIQKSHKTQILNALKVKIDDLQSRTMNENLLAIIDAHLAVIDDAYEIDMYGFQFKALLNIMNKELENIKRIIDIESS